MSEFDLVVRNGTVIDGSGLARYRADVGVRDGRIARLGLIRERGAAEIDAEGHVVTPGFVDGHTHMDAQVFWDHYGASSSWHGVTSVVMGNCGFTLAPARAEARELVVRNLERAEDIPAEALAAGIDWTWEHFSEYLDAVERLPKAINYAAYVGHSALRTFVMGERAFEEQAIEDDLRSMRAELASALEAGAMGFTTSRSDTHLTSDERPVASRVAAWDEVVDLVHSIADTDPNRLFEISVDTAASSLDPDLRNEIFGRLGKLAVGSGVPVTFGIISPGDEHRWRGLLDTIDSTNAAGGRMFGQSLPREATIVLSFRTRLPFDRLTAWKHVRSLPIEEQRRLLADPSERAPLVEAARVGPYVDSIGATVRVPDYEKIRVLFDPVGPNPTVADVARARGSDPIDTFIDLAVETGLEQFFSQCVGNPDERDVETMLSHPRMIPTFSDSGAHVGYIMESSIQTYLLAHWVRARELFSLEQAVQMLTLKPANAWGFVDRGLLREGCVADLNVFDPATVGPAPLEVARDQPAGAMRLKQRSVGFRATVVAGQPIIVDGEYTGALPGRLVRR
jgi:N-acyl-D-aspartate/D-glutamate deacylase